MLELDLVSLQGTTMNPVDMPAPWN